MTPKEAKRLVGRTIAAVDLGGSWETDIHGGSRVYMHFPTVTLDDGTVLSFIAEEHPSGDSTYGIEICARRPRRETP